MLPDVLPVLPSDHSGSQSGTRWVLVLLTGMMLTTGCTQALQRPTAAAGWWMESDETLSTASGTEAPEPPATLEATPDSVAAISGSSEPGAAIAPAPEAALPLAGPRMYGIGPIKQFAPRERPTVVALSDAEQTQMREAYSQRTREDRERVEQVNEYALWCLRREMWAEARTHLEQAVKRDSLAASLHNNLGILYERMGEPERARQAYERALILQPGKAAYQSNLHRLDGAADGRGETEPLSTRRRIPGERTAESDGLLEDLVHE